MAAQLGQRQEDEEKVADRCQSQTSLKFQARLRAPSSSSLFLFSSENLKKGNEGQELRMRESSPQARSSGKLGAAADSPPSLLLSLAARDELVGNAEAGKSSSPHIDTEALS